MAIFQDRKLIKIFYHIPKSREKLDYWFKHQFKKKQFKKKTFIGLHGLCCVTYPEIIRSGKLEGKNVGLYKVENLISAVEMRFTKKFNKFKKTF